MFLTPLFILKHGGSYLWEDGGTVMLQEVELKVQEFKGLVSTIQSNNQWTKEVKKGRQAGWSGWRRVLGEICDRRISARVKGQVYKKVVRCQILYI